MHPAYGAALAKEPGHSRTFACRPPLQAAGQDRGSQGPRESPEPLLLTGQAARGLARDPH